MMSMLLDKGVAFVLVLILCILFAVGIVLYGVQLGEVGSEMLFVPDDYATIEWAVGNATAGDTVYVRSGTYNESVSIDKPLSLIGEDMSSTVIFSEGTRGSGYTIHVKADNVTVSGFTITSYHPFHSLYYFYGVGIGGNNCNITGNIIENCREGIVSSASVHSVTISKNIIRDTTAGEGILFIYAAPHHITITGNNITNTTYGIDVQSGHSYVIYGNNVIDNGGGIGIRGSDSTITGNNLTSNTGEGINIYGSNNTISGNYVADNKVGVTFSGSNTTDNTFYNNSFIDNNQNVQITSTNYIESWDNGTVGNYWSNYNGTDTDGDGIGDTPYVIDENNRDKYPLMAPVETAVIQVLFMDTPTDSSCTHLQGVLDKAIGGKKEQ
jgi:nitrous oxidase accessory protein